MQYKELVKKMRTDLLLFQAELAEMLGVSFATVNRWEREAITNLQLSKNAL